jgi:ribosomal protein L9
MKTLGEFAAPVKLHKDVTAHSKVVIERNVMAE